MKKVNLINESFLNFNLVKVQHNKKLVYPWNIEIMDLGEDKKNDQK